MLRFHKLESFLFLLISVHFYVILLAFITSILVIMFTIKTVTITSNAKQEITPDCSPTQYTLKLDKVNNQSNGSIGGPLRFLIGRLNTSALLYRIAPSLSEISSIAEV